MPAGDAVGILSVRPSVGYVCSFLTHAPARERVCVCAVYRTQSFSNVRLLTWVNGKVDGWPSYESSYRTDTQPQSAGSYEEWI